MNFAFSEEQEELRNIVRQFLEAKSPEAAVREQMDTVRGYDPDVWSQMAEQLGLQSLIVPEEFGGQGFGYVELIVVLEEMGRSLVCAPFFSTVVLATNTLLVAGDDAAKAAILPGIASGETIATLAITEPNGKWDESGIEATATNEGGTWKISGTKSYVIDGHTADVIIVAARTAAGISLFSVDAEAAESQGLTRTPLATMDQTRKQAKLDFDGVAGHAHRHRRCRLGHPLHRPRPGRRGPGRRAGRRRPDVPRDGCAVRQGPGAVRSPDRLVPGHQAQVRRHAARGRVGQVGRLLRRVGAPRS